MKKIIPRPEWDYQIKLEDCRDLLYQVIGLLNLEIGIDEDPYSRNLEVLPQGFIELENWIKDIRAKESRAKGYHAGPFIKVVNAHTVSLLDLNGKSLFTGSVEEARKWVKEYLKI